MGNTAERTADADTKHAEQKTIREPPTPHPGRKGGVVGGEGRWRELGNSLTLMNPANGTFWLNNTLNNVDPPPPSTKNNNLLTRRPITDGRGTPVHRRGQPCPFAQFLLFALVWATCIDIVPLLFREPNQGMPVLAQNGFCFWMRPVGLPHRWATA